MYMKWMVMALTGLLALVGTAAQAQQIAMVETKLNRILMVDDDRWGGCMVGVGPEVSDTLPNCNPYYVSFSCNGTYTTEEAANRMFDTAQLAWALNKTVRIWVDDTKRHNGYCYVNRIDLVQ